jgi:hypothetical protein
MDKTEALKQIDEAVDAAEQASDYVTADQFEALTLCVSTIERLAPTNSNYRAQAALAVAGKGYSATYWSSQASRRPRNAAPCGRTWSCAGAGAGAGAGG